MHDQTETPLPSPTLILSLAVILLLPGCESPVGSGSGAGGESPTTLDHCQVDTASLMVGADWDAIRAIDDPRFEAAHELPADHLSPDERVIGFRIGGETFAIPHEEIWTHEVVNLDRSVELAVTYCPLTGSALAFDRAPVSGARMGVSGLLLHENLVMFDRNERPSLWAQMSSTSLCDGPKDERLPRWSVLEVRWETWRTLHPGTLVLDMSGDASGTPAGTVVGSPARNQRVIGAPSSPEEPGVAFPFETLVDLPGDRQVLPFEWKGKDYRLLWSDGAMGGMAYAPMTESGREVALASADAGCRDEGTGTLFTLDGRGVEGPLAGEVLVPLAETYVAYRGPWLEFHPDSRIWGG